MNKAIEGLCVVGVVFVSVYALAVAEAVFNSFEYMIARLG